MKLKSLRVENYKAFVDTSTIPMGPRFNVIVGQNSAGKTALLESVIGIVPDNPHRVHFEGEFPPVGNPRSWVAINVSMSGFELLHHLKVRGGECQIPVDPNTTYEVQDQLLTNLFEMSEIEILIRSSSGVGRISDWPSHRLFPEGQNHFTAFVSISDDRKTWTRPQRSGGNDELLHVVAEIYTASTYIFRAERLNVGSGSIGDSPVLQSNAANLSSVLLQLPGSSRAHDLYQGFVREIFPFIYRVTSRPTGSGHAQIEVTMIDGASSAGARPGLVVPLSECGTGVGQVLAILYVAVTSTTSKIIAIDEPNSFLHPGAAKKLINVLKRFDHQYLISTHSADLIKAADPDLVHLIRWDGAESRVESVNHDKLKDQRALLSEVGVSLIDVFGADNVLWVEGPTEEVCFPVILRHLDRSMGATSIQSLVATDDLTGSRPRAKLAWEVYEKLSNGTAIVPPALAFAYDREGRSEKDVSDLVRQSKGAIRFLPRRTYENYLLEPDAIAAVISAGLGEVIEARVVSVALDQKKTQKKFFDNRFQGESWIRSIDAPKVLKEIFDEISGARLAYRKTEHSVSLTKWLLQYKPKVLSELLEYVDSLLSR